VQEPAPTKATRMQIQRAILIVSFAACLSGFPFCAFPLCLSSCVQATPERDLWVQQRPNFQDAETTRLFWFLGGLPRNSRIRLGFGK
jgi:hypothetical protein